MDYILPIASIVISIIVNVFYHTVVFANKFGKIEEKLSQMEKYEKEIDTLDKRVNNFHAEIGLIKHSLENLDKEVGNMRLDMMATIKELREEQREFRDEQRESFKEQKEDTKDALKSLHKSIEKLGDRI